MSQHRVTAFDRWSTLKVVAVFSTVGLIIGPSVGFAFQDQLAPVADPYLAPIRGWLGITTTPVPIPSFAPGMSLPGAAPMAPDASASASAATSVHVDAPPAVTGKVRRQVAVPAVTPQGVGSPGTATTTVTITKTPEAKERPTPMVPAPPVITTTKEPTSVQRPNDAVRETSATGQGTTTVATSQRDASTPPVTGTTEPGTPTMGTSSVPPSTSDSPPVLQRVGLAVESEH